MDRYEMRAMPAKFKTREDGEDLIIEGHFVVFGDKYEMWSGAYETIAPEAFDETLGGDIRALADHDSRIVLGRTTAGTLELSVDNIGLFGRIRVNPKDTEAVNVYERVKRGDISQCSFGFVIKRESTEYLSGDTVHFIIEEVELYEVSVVTFPAYEKTSVSARDADGFEARRARLWRDQMKKKLKGE